MKMTTESVKKAIKKKFGGMSEFARQSGIDRLEVQTVLNTKGELSESMRKRLSAISAKAQGLKVRPSKVLIDGAKLDRLKRAIWRSGGVVNFCKQNEGFSKDSVFHILQGNRKRVGGVTKRLFEHFGIK